MLYLMVNRTYIKLIMQHCNFRVHLKFVACTLYCCHKTVLHMCRCHHLYIASSLPAPPSSPQHMHTHTHNYRFWLFPPSVIRVSLNSKLLMVACVPFDPDFHPPPSPNYRHVGKVVYTVFWYLLANIIRSTYQLSEFQTYF